jgi:hypothetical protein
MGIEDWRWIEKCIWLDDKIQIEIHSNEKPEEPKPLPPAPAE